MAVSSFAFSHILVTWSLMLAVHIWAHVNEAGRINKHYSLDVTLGHTKDQTNGMRTLSFCLGAMIWLFSWLISAQTVFLHSWGWFWTCTSPASDQVLGYMCVYNYASKYLVLQCRQKWKLGPRCRLSVAYAPILLSLRFYILSRKV